MNWKKKDAVLILTVLLIAGAAFGVHEFAGGDGADTVTVKVDGKVTGTYPLAKDQKIRINGGTNILTIKNGKAKMTDADCPDQLCVHQKAASKNHESIICLPNKADMRNSGRLNIRSMVLPDSPWGSPRSRGRAGAATGSGFFPPRERKLP